MRMSESELNNLLKNSHAKVRGDIRIPVPNVEPSPSIKVKKPYEDEAFNSPVIITIHSFRYRGDTDGIAAKWTIDAFVKAGILKDDSTKYVSEVRYKTTKIKKPDEERTVVTIHEVE
jgi:Holliday junction resolvase RusA-like endonuclease